MLWYYWTNNSEIGRNKSKMLDESTNRFDRKGKTDETRKQKLNTKHQTTVSRSSETPSRGPTRLETAGTLHQNTYRMEPTRIFSVNDVEKIISDVLKTLFVDEFYDELSARVNVKIACSEIKERVKFLGYNRYKIVSICHVVNNIHQGVNISSMSLLDDAFDNYAEVTLKYKNYDVIAVVYGVYTYWYILVESKEDTN